MKIEEFNQRNANMPIEKSIRSAYSEISLNTIESILDIADNNMYINKKQKKQLKY